MQRPRLRLPSHPQNVPCTEFDFIYIKNTDELDFLFQFYFDPTNIATINTVTRFSKSGFAFIKTFLVSATDLLTFVALVVGVVAMVRRKILPHTNWTATINIVLVAALFVTNDPLAPLRFWFNDNWLSYIENALHFFFYVTLVIFVQALVQRAMIVATPPSRPGPRDQTECHLPRH